MSETTYTLPKLPYAYDALEPAISKQIMELHHTKHHQTYITNLNAALKTQLSAAQTGDIATQIGLQSAIRFHGGGHINHSLFWENLAPHGSASTNPQAAAKLSAAISSQYGSFDALKAKFNKALLGIQGSGWGWLVKDAETGRLSIVTTKDQDPIVGGDVPIIGIDFWEHAFYLLYLTNKAGYAENIWSVINWETAEQRFNGGQEDIFKTLKATLKL